MGGARGRGRVSSARGMGGGRSSEGSKSGEAVDLETRRPFCVRFFSSKSKTFILQEVLNASLRNKSSVSMRFLICI